MSHTHDWHAICSEHDFGFNCGLVLQKWISWLQIHGRVLLMLFTSPLSSSDRSWDSSQTSQHLQVPSVHPFQTNWSWPHQFWFSLWNVTKAIFYSYCNLNFSLIIHIIPHLFLHFTAYFSSQELMYQVGLNFHSSHFSLLKWHCEFHS